MPAPAPDPEMDSNRHLANRLAAISRLPVLDNFNWTGPATPENLPGISHVSHLEKSVRLKPFEPPDGGPVLLCATTARTCWTLTIAATLLAESGIRSVMAVVLHLRP